MRGEKKRKGYGGRGGKDVNERGTKGLFQKLIRRKHKLVVRANWASLYRAPLKGKEEENHQSEE